MEHKNIVEFQLTGDYALFSDPVMRVGGEKTTLSALFFISIHAPREGSDR